MPLPPEFRFSQNNLQDFVDCERRFELRHLLKIKWPSPQTDDMLETELRLTQGARFHKLIEQHLSGVSANEIVIPDESQLVSSWWETFLQIYPTLPIGDTRFVEHTLSAPFQDYRLVAKYDLLSIDQQNKIYILDWKTSRKKPPRTFLRDRIQTRLYPALILLAERSFKLQFPVTPEKVEMIYWFAGDPHHTEVIHYSEDQFKTDISFLTELVNRIRAIKSSEYKLTVDVKKCSFCNYRSLCNRGVRAGDWKENYEEGISIIEQRIDFDQIGELEY